MLLFATGGISTWLAQLGVDNRLATMLVLIVIDFLVGVGAALRMGTFRLSYIGKFGQTDILGKVLPWAVVYVLAKATGSTNIIPGIDLDTAQDGLFVVMVGALGGSIISSLKDLGVFANLPSGVAGNEAVDPRPPVAKG